MGVVERKGERVGDRERGREGKEKQTFDYLTYLISLYTRLDNINDLVTNPVS